jgi:hypothetical protein
MVFRIYIAMGQIQSQLDPRHVGIYKKLLAIQNHATRLQMIDTCLGDPSIVQSAKFAGVYGAILQYSATVRHGSQPTPLPGETANGQVLSSPQIQSRTPTQLQYHPQSFQTPNQTNTQLISQIKPQQDVYQEVAKPKRSEKALGFFSACLKVLNIQDEVALTEENLKIAYKKAVIKAHPDKPGGSEAAFDAVTRAYAYLMDILRLVKGTQTKVGAGNASTVPGLDTLQEQRRSATSEWQMPSEPVKLNPKNLNMKVFNEMFEQTRIPDPDEEGYGDWLKSGDGGGATKMKGAKAFSKDFNREVFNQMFEEEAKGSRQNSTALSVYAPQELTLAVGMGVELGRDRPNDYTAAPNSKQQFTDLRAAYTTENTVSNKVQGIRVDVRDYNNYKSQRERAPDAYSSAELAQLQAYETQQKQREEQRRIRAAQEHVTARDYFERMKQLVITEK